MRQFDLQLVFSEGRGLEESHIEILRGGEESQIEILRRDPGEEFRKYCLDQIIFGQW